MFTGIITDQGALRSITGEAGKHLVIATCLDTSGIPLGASIACNGICLTVVETGADWFAVDASPTTLAVTTLGQWKAGDSINLERALKVGDELGGHIVTGHVDGMGEIEAVKGEAGAFHYVMSCPPELAAFIAPKGSVTLDGVSLTVTWVQGKCFGLTLIPHTLAVTNWGRKQVTDKVNLEVDVLARYAYRILKPET